jgi:hypothetical protein
MGKTPVELFRSGNAGSAKLDKPRRMHDVTVFQKNGDDRVQAGSGGMSTMEAPDNTIRGTWWRLAAGTDYNDSLLLVWNDYANHWSWDPAKDMPLSDYMSALADVNSKFVLA